MKKLVLFGCGEMGLYVLNLIGKDKVYAFCDNNPQIPQTKYGIRCITYNELRNNSENYKIIVSTSKLYAFQIANQLCDDGIYDFLIFDGTISSYIRNNSNGCEETMDWLNNTELWYGIVLKQQNYYKTIQKRQLSLLKNITDITTLCSPKGYLAAHHKSLIRFAKELFSDIKLLNIKPIVDAGTALGWERHKMIIPWDDDLDFALLREDYMRLLSFGEKNMIFLEFLAEYDMETEHKLEQIFKDNPNSYVMIVTPNCLKIQKGTSLIDYCGVDFFVYDYYKDELDFEEHKRNIEASRKLRLITSGNKHQLEMIGNLDYIVDKSNKLYPGLDSLESFFAIGWFDKDVILPLHHINFAGIECYKPNDIGTFLRLNGFENYMEWPDVILPEHLDYRIEHILKRDYVYCGIIAEDRNDIVEMKILYLYLRRKGIYTVFVICRYMLRNKWYDVIKSAYDAEVEVVYSDTDNFDVLLAKDSYNNCKIPIYRVGEKNDYEKIINFISSSLISDSKRANICKG